MPHGWVWLKAFIPKRHRVRPNPCGPSALPTRCSSQHLSSLCAWLALVWVAPILGHTRHRHKASTSARHCQHSQGALTCPGALQQQGQSQRQVDGLGHVGRGSTGKAQEWWSEQQVQVLNEESYPFAVPMAKSTGAQQLQHPVPPQQAQHASCPRHSNSACAPCLGDTTMVRDKAAGTDNRGAT